MILRQQWFDSRLKYTKLPGVRALELDPKSMDKVWVPDLYMVNEKSATIHDVTIPNKLMHIDNNGLVVYSMRFVLSDIFSVGF